MAGLSPVLRIARYDGPRSDLRPMFEMAEDSAQQLDSYIDDGEVLVAYADDILVGHLQLVTPDDRVAEIKNMAVAVGHRGHGVGRALVTHAIDVSRGRGCALLLVRTATADAGNLRFYQRLGFRCVAIESDAFTPATGYPADLETDGIPVRDAVVLSQELADTHGRAVGSQAVGSRSPVPGSVDLRRLDPQRPDRQDLDGAVTVLEAARAVDCPHQPPLTGSAFAARLRHGFDGDAPLTAVFRDRGGTVAGVLEVSLPHWDNRNLGEVAVTIDPVARGQGLGTGLFELGVEQVHRAGRTLVYAHCLDQPGPVAFLKAIGLDRAYEDVQRRHDLRALDWGRLDDVYAEAEGRAAGYQLIWLPGPTPPDMLPDIVRMTGTINDAPTGALDIEDEVFSPERIRALEAAQQAQGWRLYRMVARHRSTGMLAGHTMTAVQGEQPWYGCQYDTSVLPAHRGHRLGLFLKIGMLRWLAEAEPQLRFLDTWNAAANAHMIGINEALGYRVLSRGIGWQRHL